jgi:hypothetical protein
MSIGSKPELLLEEAWTVDESGRPERPMKPHRRIWIAQAQTDYIEIEPFGSDEPIGMSL